MTIYENDKVRIEKRDNHERIYPKVDRGLSLWDMLDHYRYAKNMTHNPFSEIQKDLKDVPSDTGS